jgi:N-methylhydantoinase A/oxoprolinase/acetone carboxylase beta subunit
MISLGVDTGGTYTDAVLFDDVEGVVATAKALTTRHDLAVGIAEAVDGVLPAAPEEVALVSLSTTLATNALVEGKGGRVALVFIGFGERDDARGGLSLATGTDPVIRIDGGHDALGDSVTPVDLAALEAAVVGLDVSAFAVTAQFATRNPAHEIAARDLLRELTGLPITCGHELSARLNGPRRALTSVLNARLIGLTTNLIDAASAMMTARGLDCPLMVVRGDGSLMSVEVARQRPIETILSGPAASIVGAAHLTGLSTALVSDIGGTTTDIALIEDGAPRLDDSGARVGGHRTMVEAVAITTIGLGGDSEVAVSTRTAAPTLLLGPRRVVPIALAAAQFGDAMHSELDRELLQDSPTDHDGRFVLPIAEAGASPVGLDAAERSLLERARTGIAPVAALVRRGADVRRLDRLVARGLIALAAFTPTDASHVLGDFVAHDVSAAAKAAELMARRRTMLGRPVAEDGKQFAAWVVAALQRRSAETILGVGLDVDGYDEAAAAHPLLAASLEGRRGLVDVAARLTAPLVGLGASARLYYPAVGSMLRTEAVIPDHADVANAVGAVVGHVRSHADVYVSSPSRDRYRVHHADGATMASLDDALDRAERCARADAIASALESGAADPVVSVDRSLNIVEADGERLFVDATVTAVATGRPRITR